VVGTKEVRYIFQTSEFVLPSVKGSFNCRRDLVLDFMIQYSDHDRVPTPIGCVNGL